MRDCGFSPEVIESELAAHGAYASVTKGTSMRPLFKTNRDVIIVKPPVSELKKYDVALYRSILGAYTLHRVIAVRDNEYVIRGDNTYKKEYVAKDRVIAVLTEFNRNGKKHTVNDFSYRLYSRIWNFIYPIRYLFVKARAIIARILRRGSHSSKQQ